MAANVYMNWISLTSPGWQPLAPESVVVNATIIAFPPSGGAEAPGAMINLRFRGQTACPVPFNTEFRLEGVDLSEIEAQWLGDNAYVTCIGTSR